MPWRAWLRSSRARILAAALATVAMAALAVLALSPSQPGPAASPVDAADYFSAAQLERSTDYRQKTRAIGLCALLVEFGLLALIALRPPRRAAAWMTRAQRHPLLGAAAAAAAISVTLALAGLPLGIWAHDLATSIGLSVQDLGGWLYDWIRSLGIGALYAAAGGALLILLQRRLPRAWPLAGAAVIVAFAAATTFLSPVLLAPIFNDFEELPPGRQRAEVLDLAQRAGVEVGQVYRVDASSRKTALNAYVAGLGSTRRVVIYDNLLDTAERPALRSVVAHELGHVAQDDLSRGILFVALVAPLGMLFVRETGGALAARAGTGPGEVRALPAYALVLTLTAFGLGIAGNQLSRQVEERADRFALELTADPRGLEALQLDLAGSNFSDPDPPGWWRAVFGTHPSTVQRLGLARAYLEQAGAQGPEDRPRPG